MGSARKSRQVVVQPVTPPPVVASVLAGASGMPGIVCMSDMALKRYEHQDKAIDALTVKAGVIFGTSTLVLTLTSAMLAKLNGWQVVVVGGLTLGLYLCMTYRCWAAYKVLEQDALPDVGKMLEAHEHMNTEANVKFKIATQLTLASDGMETLMKKKASHVEAALRLLLAQIIAAILGQSTVALFTAMTEWLF